MLLTEEEAKKKWCPETGEEKCIASGCMAWRWGEKSYQFRILDSTQTTKKEKKELEKEGWKLIHREVNKKDPYSNTWTWRRPMPDGTDRGYCGLAGKPEGTE